MKKISQRSYASRLDRAEKMHQHLTTFVDFQPGDDDLTAAGFRLFVTNLTALHTQHQGTQYDFIEEAKERRKVFTGNPDSLNKISTSLKTYTRGKFGADSHEFKTIEKFVGNMRGHKPASVTRNSEETTISQSETSYGAQLVNFQDIVSTVGKWGAQHAPANTKLKLPSLQEYATIAAQRNNAVAQKYALHKPTIAGRQEGFAELSNRTTRIKDMVSSQYGTNSPEYKLIKGLNFTI